jgi:hypothetical protein
MCNSLEHENYDVGNREAFISEGNDFMCMCITLRMKIECISRPGAETLKVLLQNTIHAMTIQ